MAGILDFFSSPSSSFGILNSDAGPDYRGLNPDAGDLGALDAALKPDPYAGLDKKQKEEAARKAALGAFDTGAPAVPAAGISGRQAMNVSPFGALAPVLPAPQPPQAPAPTPIAQPAVPMPAPRPASAPAPIGAPSSPSTVDDTTLPANATPTSGQNSPPIPETSLMGRIGAGLKQFGEGIDNHKSELLAMAGGLAGAPSWGTGLSRGFTAAAAAQPMDQRNTDRNQTVQALMKRGMPEDVARSAASNPAILQQILPQVFGAKQRKYTTIKDSLGNETPVFADEANGRLYDMSGNAINSPSPGSLNPSTAAQPNYDPTTKRDEAFLGTLDPVTGAAVKDIADGNMSGTGRNLQKLMPLVARYEQGFSNGTYTSRNKFNTELGSQSASTVGGQKVLMGTALGHLGEAAEAAADLGNVNGMGSADVGHAANFVANRTTTNAAKANSLSDKVAKFSGEVGKLYSGSSGGGVHEREESRGRLGSNLTSAELAAGLESNRDLILSKQHALEQHAVDLFGPEGAKRFDFIGPEGRKSLEKIEKAIATLKGTAPAAAPAAAPDTPASPTPGPPIRSGKYTWSSDKGLQQQ